MKAFHVLPLNYIHLVEDNLFILPQFLTEETYVEFARNFKGFKMLDNGAHEGRTASIDELLDIAEELKVNRLVIPDERFDEAKTLHMAEEFMDVLSFEERKKYELVAVPQGETFTQFIHCYKELVSMDPDIIGICKDFGRLEDFNLIECIRPWLIQHFFNEKPVHLLGTCTLRELSRYKHIPNVLSVDTNDAAKHSKIIGKTEYLEPHSTKTKRKWDWLLPYNREREIIMRRNMEFINRIISDETVIRGRVVFYHGGDAAFYALFKNLSKDSRLTYNEFLEPYHGKNVEITVREI